MRRRRRSAGFAPCFSQICANHPSRFLNAIRLDEAALCLVYANCEIGDIAMDIGLDSLSYFEHLLNVYHDMSLL